MTTRWILPKLSMVCKNSIIHNPYNILVFLNIHKVLRVLSMPQAVNVKFWYGKLTLYIKILINYSKIKPIVKNSKEEEQFV